MSTNYYLESPRCKDCGHAERVEHLGKSSVGWVFSLHIYPESGIHDLSDIEKWIKRETVRGQLQICSEYGEVLSWMDFLVIVTKRSNPRIIRDGWESEWWNMGGWPHSHYYTSEGDFHCKNSSKRGPSGLLRHRVDDNHCVANGAGTWDLIIGEFS
jgi:hypothetical protein